MRTGTRYATVLVAALTGLFSLALTGCKSPVKTAGKATATTTVQGAKSGAKATAKGAQTVGGAAVDVVTPNRNR